MTGLIPNSILRVVERYNGYVVGESLRKVIVAVEEADFLAADLVLKQLPDETNDPRLNQAIRMLRDLAKRYEKYEKYLESMKTVPLPLHSLPSDEIRLFIVYANKRGIKIEWKKMIMRDSRDRVRIIPVLIRAYGEYNDIELR